MRLSLQYLRVSLLILPKDCVVLSFRRRRISQWIASQPVKPASLPSSSEQPSLDIKLVVVTKAMNLGANHLSHGKRYYQQCNGHHATILRGGTLAKNIAFTHQSSTDLSLLYQISLSLSPLTDTNDDDGVVSAAVRSHPFSASGSIQNVGNSLPPSCG